MTMTPEERKVYEAQLDQGWPRQATYAPDEDIKPNQDAINHLRDRLAQREKDLTREQAIANRLLSLQLASAELLFECAELQLTILKVNLQEAKAKRDLALKMLGDPEPF